MSKRYSSNEMRLYAHDGSRLYVNESERVAYIKAANGLPPLVRLFCLTLVYTGCRLSEARNLRSEHFQIDERRVSIHTLKRRKSGCIRELPIPDELVEAFNASRSDHGKRGFLFSKTTRPPARTVSYRWVKGCMAQAGIEGSQACPKGLRHGFGIHATRCGVQLHMLQKWMGHASMNTTAIYATALGPEEAEIAGRMW